jgi:hypothetical protein
LLTDPVEMTNSAKRLPGARRALGRISTLAVAIFLVPAGCVPSGWGRDGRETPPAPEPEPEPQPEPSPECKGPAGYSAWVTLSATAGGELDPRVEILNCADEPLYVYADGCFGTVVRLERVYPDGSIEEVAPPWLCAWGGPTDPVVIAPFDSYIQSNQEYGNFLSENPGDYRFVFRVTYDFSCPDAPAPGGPWPCSEEQPWVEVATALFTVGG